MWIPAETEVAAEAAPATLPRRSKAKSPLRVPFMKSTMVSPRRFLVPRVGFTVLRDQQRGRRRYRARAVPGTASEGNSGQGPLRRTVGAVEGGRFSRFRRRRVGGAALEGRIFESLGFQPQAGRAETAETHQRRAAGPPGVETPGSRISALSGRTGYPCG